ncbi:SpoIVB peptidase [Pseudoflavonifractor phocaeensis]|uniref:SpoIVB peptidase n=1 Tax=Pseudoflavonifractor phocaeensis TaxID=1870988 RepID=UPI00313F2D7B
MKEEHRERPGAGYALPLLRAAAVALVLLGLMGQGGAFARAAEVRPVSGAASVRTVVPVGRAVGIKLFSDGVMVVGFSQIPAAGGNATPAKSCGLKEGDIITHINAAEVDTIEEVQEQLAQVGGQAMSIRALRNGHALQVTAQAVQCSTDGSYKLGAWLRDSMAGIGTVTYYDPATGDFGALGHGINDVDTAQLMPMESGNVLGATVSDVKKGRRGEPGELHGAFDLTEDLGELRANTAHGIFGTLSNDSLASGLEPVEVAARNQVETGKAVIYSNISGDEVKAYEVEITKLFPNASDGRDMMVKVTDPALLAATGGIVQGMSGSPILQNGRLVGAVTHVLVGDPTQGYGIQAENMLQAGAEAV